MVKKIVKRRGISLARTSADPHSDDDVEYDDTDDEQDEKEWVEDEKAAKSLKVEQYADMPTNEPGDPPPKPEDQPPVEKDYDLYINQPAKPPDAPLVSK